MIPQRSATMAESLILWYDIVNPSDVWFFGPLLRRLNDFESVITIRDRAETKALAITSGIKGKIVGKHYTDQMKKNIGMPARFIKLLVGVRNFDVGLSFENGLALTACRLKGRPSILFCDNDLKLLDSGSLLQDIENKLKSKADHLVIPSACHDTFRRFVDEEKITVYDGYKEDVYIADFIPDKDFSEKLPAEDYVVVRPEALDSSYVGSAKSIVPALLKQLTKEGITVVYLPREKGDREHSRGFDVLVPRSPLNGLDLCYNSRAVLTGSGTMAREAACMGKPAVSFFPGKQLLSVDRQLVKDGWMVHTRSPEEIANYVLRSKGSKAKLNFDRSRTVQASLMRSVVSILSDIRR